MVAHDVPSSELEKFKRHIGRFRVGILSLLLLVSIVILQLCRLLPGPATTQQLFSTSNFIPGTGSVGTRAIENGAITFEKLDSVALDKIKTTLAAATINNSYL